MHVRPLTPQRCHRAAGASIVEGTMRLHARQAEPDGSFHADFAVHFARFAYSAATRSGSDGKVSTESEMISPIAERHFPQLNSQP
jgi:hypothetical protein